MKGRSMRGAIALGAAALALAMAWPVTADAHRGGRAGYGMVSATSWYDPNKRITAPVRRRNGSWEVRLPGGTWLPCFGGCANTLRTEYLDFWMEQFQGGGHSR